MSVAGEPHFDQNVDMIKANLENPQCNYKEVRGSFCKITLIAVSMGSHVSLMRSTSLLTLILGCKNPV